MELPFEPMFLALLFAITQLPSALLALGFLTIKRAQLGLRHFFTKLECCMCISNTAFQACIMQNLSFVKAGEELESGLPTSCKLYSLTFFSQSPASKVLLFGQLPR